MQLRAIASQQKLLQQSSKNFSCETTAGGLNLMARHASLSEANAFFVQYLHAATHVNRSLVVVTIVETTWGICTRRAGKLYRARSRLYRSQLLQVDSNYLCESSRRDLHNTLLCTALRSQF